MQPHLINYFFTNEIIQAMFRTLIHSLWQGILLAAVAGLILAYTKNTGSGLRYKLLCGVLLAFVVTSFATFCYELYAASYNTAVATKAIAPVVANNYIATAQQQFGFVEKIITALKSSADFIVLAWFIIITLKSITLLTGLQSIHRLKRTQVSDAGDYWNHQLKILAAKAGVTKQVTLLKSAIAEIPMVLGHLKPVILFPASALTTLATEEIEAILLHELAHIRRKDYLVNILQNLAEILFFFNPAVLWISSLIKEERENCCDDIAIKQVKNKKQFIRALVSFQEYNLSSKYAASFSGGKNHLLNRIKRIITNNNKTLSNMEKIFLATGIIVTCFMAAAFTTRHKQSSVNAPSFVQPVKAVAVINRKDTVPPSSPTSVNNNESKSVINSELDGKQYKLVEVNGKVTELYVNNTRVPDDKLQEYNSVINKLQEKLKEDQKQQVAAMKLQQMALDTQVEKMKAQALAMNDMAQMKSEVQKQVVKANELIKKVQVEKMNEIMKEKSIMMKDQAKKLAETMKDKDVMMKDQAEKLANIMKEKNEVMKDQAEKLAERMKDKDVMMKDQAEKLANIMKEKNEVMKDQAEKLAERMKETDEIKNQSKVIKEKTDKLIQQDLKKQIEELKQQNESLKQQLKQKADSIYKSNLVEPGGA